MVRVVTCFLHSYSHKHLYVLKLWTLEHFERLPWIVFVSNKDTCTAVHQPIDKHVEIMGNLHCYHRRVLLTLNPRTFWTLSYQTNLDISYDSFHARTFIFLYVPQFQLWTFRTFRTFSNITNPWTYLPIDVTSVTCDFFSDLWKYCGDCTTYNNL